MKFPLWLRYAVVALLIAAGAAWLSTRFEWVDETVPGKVKGEALRDPYYAARLLVKQLGYATQVVNDPDALAQQDTTATIVAFKPFQGIVRRRIEPRLLAWVRNGGNLVMPITAMSSEFKQTIGLRVLGTTLPATGANKRIDLDLPQEVTVEAQTLMVSLFFCETFVLDNTTPDWSAFVTGYTPLRNGAADEPDTRADMQSPIASAMARKNPVVQEPALIAARWQVGKGSITALCSNTMFSNYNIGKAQNAEFAARALLNDVPGTLIFAPRPEYPGLFAWLLEKAWTVLISLPVLLLLALWRTMPRLGPVAPSPAPVRPSLQAHLAAVANFHLRRGHLLLLLQAAREQLQAQIQRRYGKPETHLRELSTALGISIADLQRALYREPHDRIDYYRISRLLAQATQRLQAGTSRTSTPTFRSVSS